jgi:hypothetical protein
MEMKLLHFGKVLRHWRRREVSASYRRMLAREKKETEWGRHFASLDCEGNGTGKGIKKTVWEGNIVQIW